MTTCSGSISYKRVVKIIYVDFFIFYGQINVFYRSERLLDRFSGKTWIVQNVGKN
jgi:hypothetical protein